MIDHLSMMPAQRGNMSDSRMPGTFVRMVPNSPRYSAGASGLGSHMSMWLGPPRIHRMMTELRRVAAAEFACASWRNSSASDRPALPSTPALTKPRRLSRSSRRNSGQPMELARWDIEPPKVGRQDRDPAHDYSSGFPDGCKQALREATPRTPRGPPSALANWRTPPRR